MPFLICRGPWPLAGDEYAWLGEPNVEDAGRALTNGVQDLRSDGIEAFPISFNANSPAVFIGTAHDIRTKSTLTATNAIVCRSYRSSERFHGSIGWTVPPATTCGATLLQYQSFPQ